MTRGTSTEAKLNAYVVYGSGNNRRKGVAIVVCQRKDMH